jgi:hypothetical protein
LFDYLVSDREMVLIHRNTKTIQDYDDFIEAVFAWLWQVTDHNLQRVRHHLQRETFPRLDQIVRAKIESIEGLPPFSERDELLRLLSLARSDIRTAVDRVETWFTRASDQAFADYQISVAFEAARATVQSYYSDLELSAAFSGGWGTVMAGHTLPYITKMFSLLLENAAKHSGIKTGTLNLESGIDVADNEMVITIKSPLGPSIDVHELDKRIVEINRDYKRDAAVEAVATERGSGFAKIWNLLEHDLRRAHTIEVSRLDNVFSVQILIDLEGVVS